MKESLRQRKDRKRPAKLSEEEQQGLSEEEKKRLLEARELQSEADREREEMALLEARRLLEKVVHNFHFQSLFSCLCVSCFALNLFISLSANKLYGVMLCYKSNFPVSVNQYGMEIHMDMRSYTRLSFDISFYRSSLRDCRKLVKG